MNDIESRRRRNLMRLLSPRSIAFIGGHGISEAIRQCILSGFSGEIWPVSPKYTELGGISCLPSLAELPRAPDASFIAVRRETTIEIVRELAAMGAGGCVCYAAGFAETGDKGAALQRALVEAAGDLALIGPNCYGILNYLDGIALWPSGFGGGRVERGIAMISQSGNIALNLTMSQRSVPFAYVLSIGNQAVLGIADYIDTLIDDSRVTAIGLYIEGLTDVQGFSRAAVKALQRGVPLVALKTGRSGLGARLTLSHTSSLAGDDQLYSALFDRLGIIRVATLPALLETLKLVAVSGPPAGDRLAVFTCSGGDSLMAADEAADLNITLPELAPTQAEALSALLPDFATVSNPLDYNTALWGDRQALTKCFGTALESGFDAGLLIIDYPEEVVTDRSAYDAAVDAFVTASEGAGIVGAVASTLPELLPADVRQRLLSRRIAPLQGLEDAMCAIASTIYYTQRRAEIMGSEGEAIVHRPCPVPVDPVLLNEIDSKHSLAKFGLAIPVGRIVTAAEAASAAAQIGLPVVVKVASPVFTHKTEAGAVRLGLVCESDVNAAVVALTNIIDRSFPDKTAELFLVEQQITEAVAELIVGVRRDDLFGLVLVVGAGGTLVELVEDSVTMLLPTNRSAIARAIAKLRVARLLNGYRGRPAGDVDAAINAIMAVTTFAQSRHNHLVELDVNPLLVLPRGRGAVAVDALIVMDSSGLG